MDGAHTHGSSGGGAPVALLAVVVLVIAAIARPVAAAADAVLRVVTEVLEVVAIVVGAAVGLAVLSGAVWLAVRVATSPAGRRARASVRVVAARRSTGRTAPRTRVIIASPTGELAVREPPLALAVGALHDEMAATGRPDQALIAEHAEPRR
jgi:hypothetical protein